MGQVVFVQSDSYLHGLGCDLDAGIRRLTVVPEAVPVSIRFDGGDDKQSVCQGVDRLDQSCCVIQRGKDLADPRHAWHNIPNISDILSFDKMGRVFFTQGTGFRRLIALMHVVTYGAFPEHIHPPNAGYFQRLIPEALLQGKFLPYFFSGRNIPCALSLNS
jgi:hypothetical protein